MSHFGVYCPFKQNPPYPKTASEVCHLSLTLCASLRRPVVPGGQRENVSSLGFFCYFPQSTQDRLDLRFNLFSCSFCIRRGENVEDAFLEAAKKIYQNIQDGSLDLNAAESGVQHKPSAPQGGRLTSEPQPQREGCGC